MKKEKNQWTFANASQVCVWIGQSNIAVIKNVRGKM